MNTATTSYLALIFVTSLVLVVWYSGTNEAIKPPATTNQDNSPDTFFHNFTIKDYNEQGKLKYHLKAIYAEHYPLTESASIKSPEIRLYSEHENTDWLARAASGQLDKAGKLLTLENKVQLYNDKPPMQRIILTTDKLIINIDNEIAYTDASVLIQNLQGRMESIGLEADLKNTTLKLKSSVKGYHDPL